jgi:predicted CXXCH cytochrome family protein
MKIKIFFATLMVVSIAALGISGHIAYAGKKMPDTVTIKIEGSKIAPVKFSHEIHTKKLKNDCSVCHHKDQNPKEPQACTACHPPKEAEGATKVAKDAFHKLCQTCHKENVAKGVKAPTKCAECHKRTSE